jgi:transposase
MRKSIDALADVVEPMLRDERASGTSFCVLGKGRDKVKLLIYDRHRFWLMYKQLERGRFTDPRAFAAGGLAMAELTAWLKGRKASIWCA